MFFRHHLTVGLLGLLLLAGCSASGTPVSVHGNVTLDGQPLADAEVQFVPKGNDSLGTLSATTDADGNFGIESRSFNTATSARYAVTVRKFRAGSGNAGMAMANAIPPIYADPQRTPLTAEVHVGGNDVGSLALTSKPSTGAASNKK